MPINQQDIKRRFEKAWEEVSGISYRDTIRQQETWVCAVAALALQRKYGGDILEADIPQVGGHAWNRLPDGTEIDLTRDQFKQGTVVPSGTILDTKCRGFPQHVIDKVEKISPRL